jgi:hypothetical protein
MPSEETPLLRDEGNELPRIEGLATKSWISTAISIPLAAFRWHGVSIAVAIMSAVACWALGFAERSIFDPLIFKSIFVIFGFAIGFRNSRANQRLNEAHGATHELFAAAWSILVVFPSDSRPKIREALLYLLDAISEHVHVIAHRDLYKYGIVGIRPAPLESAAWWDCSRRFSRPSETSALKASVTPRPLMATTLFMFEEEFESINSKGRTIILRTFHQQTLAFKKSFDAIVVLAMPSVSDRLVMLINFCLFMFAIALPWGIKSTHLNFYGVNPDPKVDEVMAHFSAGGFLVLNTFVCTTVLFGLNALAQEHEDPFGADTDDIDLKKMAQSWCRVVQIYEERRAVAERGKYGFSSEEVAKQHRFICHDVNSEEKV